MYSLPQSGILENMQLRERMLQEGYCEVPPPLGCGNTSAAPEPSPSLLKDLTSNMITLTLQRI